MYALYQKENISTGQEKFFFKRQISLFGCNSGWIPWLLSQELGPHETEPLRWHIDVHAALAAANYPNHALLINLKPNATEPNLSLYEIANVWGFSDCGWTPIMLHLRGLFIDEDARAYDDREFERTAAEIDEPIFSMLYLTGSVESGAIVGTWVAPRPSPTNAALLWPETLDFFVEAANAARRRHT